jgi:ribonuclease HII
MVFGFCKGFYFYNICKHFNGQPAYLYSMLLPYYQKKLMEAGCDEAGRGCYAGPVYAAAVIFPKKFKHALIRDSKKLREEERTALKSIIEHEALSWGVAGVSETEIDATNILKASIKAMHLAIEKLCPTPSFLIIDGNRFYPYKNIQHQTIIKGDGLYLSIAAASILAKTTRDAYMKEIHYTFPQYNWLNNKGYGTLEHRKAIEKYGLSPYHRKSFRIMPDCATLF